MGSSLGMALGRWMLRGMGRGARRVRCSDQMTVQVLMRRSWLMMLLLIRLTVRDARTRAMR